MKKSTFSAILFFVILALVAMNVEKAKAQDISTDLGSMVYDEGTGKYRVELAQVTRNTAVNMLVDQCIKGKVDIQQIGGFVVTYDGDYTIDLEEGIADPRNEYPKSFTNISDVKKQLKLDLKEALDNL